MNSHRFNQLAMAVLAALVLFFGTRTLIDILYSEHETETAGYKVPGAEKEEGGEAKEEAKEEKPEILTLLADANADKGAGSAGICKGCHTVDKGGPNMVGPNLYDIVGRKVGGHEGYDYSPALKEHGGVWDYANLDDMIKHPAVHIPGTKMAMYPGMPDAKKRANVIAYLRTLSDDPEPLPEGGDDSAAAASGDDSAAEEPTEAEEKKATEEQKGPPEEPMSEEPNEEVDSGSESSTAPTEESGSGEEPNEDAGSEPASTDASEAPAESTPPDEEPNADAGMDSESDTQ